MEEHNSLLRLLLLQSERLSEQMEGTNTRLHEIDKTVLVLAGTVIEHQKGSIAMQQVQADCRKTCDSHIEAVEKMAKSVDITLMKSYAIIKALVVIFSGITGIIGLLIGIMKLIELFRHAG